MFFVVVVVVVVVLGGRLSTLKRRKLPWKMFITWPRKGVYRIYRYSRILVCVSDSLYTMRQSGQFDSVIRRPLLLHFS